MFLYDHHQLNKASFIIIIITTTEHTHFLPALFLRVQSNPCPPLNSPPAHFLLGFSGARLLLYLAITGLEEPNPLHQTEGPVSLTMHPFSTA